jgi:phosphatidylserine decarboxylase
MFGEEGRWTPAEDLLRTTAEGLETFVRLGEPVAHAL